MESPLPKNSETLPDDLAPYIDVQEKEQILTILTRNLKSFYIPRVFRGIIFWVVLGPLWIILHNVFSSINRVQTISDRIFLIIAILWAVSFLISMSVAKLFVQGHQYVITTTRIILFRKFIGISFREIEYKRITDLVLYQSLWGRFWNFGNLLPVTAGIEMGVGKMGRFSIEGVYDVFHIRTLLLDQIRVIQDQILAEFQQKALNKSESNLPSSE